MNELVVCWCRGQGLEVTRSRAYRKNDQAWVEQKNGAIVRRLVGYGRFGGGAAASAGPALRRGAAARQPVPAVVQAAGEEPDRGPRDQALSCAGSAAARVLAMPACRGRQGATAEAASRGRSRAAVRRDPWRPGGSWQTGRPSWPEPRARGADRDRPAALRRQPEDGLARRRDRPTHRRPYRRRKPNPKRSACSSRSRPRSGLAGGRAGDPGGDGAAAADGWTSDLLRTKSLRTVQRAVKAWRAEVMRRIILDGDWIKRVPASPPAAEERSLTPS